MNDVANYSLNRIISIQLIGQTVAIGKIEE